jgi:chemotaxis protein histidine kinase CheA
MDDGGMSIRLDPRRLGALKLLAAEAGVRPGELVTHWVEERLDAARSGAAAPSPVAPDALAALASRVDELYRRLDQVATAPAQPPAVESAPDVVAIQATIAPPKRGRGRPRKVVEDAAPATPAAARPKRSAARRSPGRRKAAGKPKVALHDEIASVIAERGPQTAAELAAAIAERGRYHAPRSAKPLDAAAVNARVSNPTYRGRFVRREHRIGLVAE